MSAYGGKADIAPPIRSPRRHTAGPKADIAQQGGEVRFMPKADIQRDFLQSRLRPAPSAIGVEPSGNHHFWRAVSTRSIRSLMTALLRSGNTLTGARKAIVSPNTV